MDSDRKKEERMKIIKLFNDMDASGDGFLSIKEVRDCILHSGLPARDVKVFMKNFDLNHDNKVTLDELETALGLKEVPKTTIDDWRKAFLEFDVDRSGELSAEELQSAVKSVGVEISLDEIKSLIASVDKDASGKLNIQEFFTLMKMI